MVKCGAIYEMPHVPTATAAMHLAALKTLCLAPQDAELAGSETGEETIRLKVLSDYLPVVAEGAEYTVRKVLGA